MFRFKQFSVDQTGCAMKINTDGVLLGAMAAAENPATILDIGTGTGVIGLMLAQRFANARIDAVEIDSVAADTASNNFKMSVFHDRMNVFATSIRAFFDGHSGNKYDLIVSNPPFFINSLESPKAKTTLAKHTGAYFFELLIKDISGHLSPNGVCWMILPLQTVGLITELIILNGMHLKKKISVHSFEESPPHREVLSFGFDEESVEIGKLTIYKGTNIYTDGYKRLLHPYFLAF